MADSMRDPRHDVLFEPVQLGPVTAKNRFYQVPHCNGLGHRDVTALAEMRKVKAEGGWAVVCTEEVEIHPSSDVTPSIEGRLWSDDDIPALARVAEAIHDGGALAGIELTHNGIDAPNLWSREIPIGPSAQPTVPLHPIQARQMTEADIADVRRWHRAAVRRSLQAGYDLVYVYAGHGLALLQQFLSPRTNHRTDAYGGSPANRLRLLREVLEETLEECQGRAAVAVRLCVDELLPGGLTLDDTRGVLEEIGEHPDLWDFMVGDWPNDSITARFGPEASHSETYAQLSGLTSKPVVGVGRFTSPDTMAQHVRDGVVDMIGAARPSIADPFLPAKIEAGRAIDIRECIGCNICVAGDNTSSGIRCTQNPTMGVEWRRGWHPERVPATDDPARVLVAGAGPAGLEATHILAKAGHQATLLESTRELGGRARRESRLPGLATWIRVSDYRELQLDLLPGAEVYRESPVSTDDVLEFGFPHILVATGSHWRRDGAGRAHPLGLDIADDAPVLTPDDLLDGVRPAGQRVVVYDDDHYYMAGAVAELLADGGHHVTVVCPAPQVSAWTANTLEVDRIQARLLGKGIRLLTQRRLTYVGSDHVAHACRHTGDVVQQAADAAVLVTSRVSHAPLADELRARRAEWADAGIVSVRAIGDALAPGTIAAAVYSGHQAARQPGTDHPDPALAIRREITALAPRH